MSTSKQHAERRKTRFAVVATAALHKRLNRERRQEKATEIEAAIDAVDDIIAGKNDVAVPPLRVLDVWDRWCANCKSHRVDDPCEVCARHTRDTPPPRDGGVEG